jgi:hypothetical protein
MLSTQRRFLSGTRILTSNARQTVIALPLLPDSGAWAIFGTIFAVRLNPPGAAVAYYPTYTGRCQDCVATTADVNPPSDGDNKSPSPTFEPGGPRLIVAGRQAEIAFIGGEAGVSIAWGWELEVVTMSLE